ncbi:MAG: hypothetical protein QS748_03670 [Candidatus Endonucleobacter bathymodioli]|uniref:Uncharacterized protein n=1 Tax=Candidatus Endonucleibacter bathymodioli TaxID=539814 RepID=A0AA90SCP1_9GAMM|nr:hypothetical protein [Candidatus Endonucleobacter bathymodioli]
MNKINHINTSIQLLNQEIKKNKITQKTKWSVISGLKNFFRSSTPASAIKLRNIPLANRQVSKLSSFTQYTASSRANARINQNRVSPQQPSVGKISAFKKHESASQSLSDLNSIILFKKDLYSALSNHTIDNAQFEKLSGKIAASLFKLARNPSTTNMPRQTITKLVGSHKASEILAVHQNHTAKLKSTQADKKEDISLTDNQSQQLLEGLDELKLSATAPNVSLKDTQAKQQLIMLDDRALSTLPLSDLSSIKTFKHKLQAAYTAGNINKRQYDIHTFRISKGLRDLIRKGETRGVSTAVLKFLVPLSHAVILQRMLTLSLKRR